MQIPLDYYRILGLPIQATPEQLRQAHRDRGLQLPRREFSETAIEARKQLIDEAYQVLANNDSRQGYDSKFLANAYKLDLADDPPSQDHDPELSPDLGEAALRSLATEAEAPDGQGSTIEITAEQFVGALLILLELGEYEQVLQLGRPYLSSGRQSLANGHLGDPNAAQADIVLTLALACLELGREQWQQRHYEIAAASLEVGNDLLTQENQFPAIRAEIQAELYKLRPYRILELLARPLDQTRERRQGLKLLKTMLEDRGGIEGTEDDLSGLAIDDFLRFIQQLRDYLTASEQQELFEHEARRPSPVATYLTVYALLARGFARHQPALVRRAKQLLMRLGAQQDVHLEQAVCAVLLGQTEEANRALELSQEYEPLAYIREHSRHSPDLLPGLCLYAERWLRDELFPHFRDFKDQDATLKAYFSDAQVQAYLESMPANPATAAPLQSPQFPTIPGSLPIGAPTLSQPMPMATPGRVGLQAPPPRAAGHTGHNGQYASVPGATPPPGTAASGENGYHRTSELDLDPDLDLDLDLDLDDDDSLLVAERVAQLSPEGKLRPAGGKADHPGSAMATTTLAPGQGMPPRTKGLPRRLGAGTAPNWGRLALVGVAGLLGVGLLGFVAMRTVGLVAGSFSGPKLEGEPLDISVAQPAVEIPAAPGPDEQIGVNDIAQGVIEEWLAIKQEALGKDYQSNRLKDILVEPMLTQWQRRADAAAEGSWYWKYTHNVEVQSVTPDDPTADQLQVTATVAEKAQMFEYDVENANNSYDDVLQMQYNLVRQDGKWYIEGMGKLGSEN
ncbi:MAG: IMS domain-containing protein [Nodosilinea sp.]